MARDDETESGERAYAAPSPEAARVLDSTTYGAGPAFSRDEQIVRVERRLALAQGREYQPAPGWPTYRAPGATWGDAERRALLLEALLERRRSVVETLWIETHDTDAESVALHRLATGGDRAEHATSADELAAIDAKLATIVPDLFAIAPLARGIASASEPAERAAAAAVVELAAALPELRARLLAGEGSDVAAVRWFAESERALSAARLLAQAPHIAGEQVPVWIRSLFSAAEDPDFLAGLRRSRPSADGRLQQQAIRLLATMRIRGKPVVSERTVHRWLAATQPTPPMY